MNELTNQERYELIRRRINDSAVSVGFIDCAITQRLVTDYEKHSHFEVRMRNRSAI
jgi:hypothetical protein